MQRFVRFLIAALVFSTAARAEWITLPWPAINANLPIWRPDDFNPERKYPAIVWYGPKGENPDASWIHEMTGGSDFILVGMGYRQVPDSEFGETEIADALGLLKALKQTLVGSLSVDPDRIHVGGFGRGAKHSAILLDRDRELAGGLICATGLFEKRRAVMKFTEPIPIYIGCGRLDANYPQTLGAAVYFKQSGAETTIEVWPDIKHEHPDSAPEGMRQWLLVQAGHADLKKEATYWITACLLGMEEIENPVAQWLAYDEFLALPFVEHFGAQAKQTAETKIAGLMKNPAVAKEAEWRDKSRKMLVLESRDRLLKTLRTASAGHAMIAEQATGTHAAELATHDLARTRELLRTAEVVKLPSDPKPAPVTPHGTPSGPSTNPERTPFIPPGIDVKPAD